MRPKSKVKPVVHKILEGESDKLKEKLEALKAQVQLRKKQKGFSQTTTTFPLQPARNSMGPSSSTELQQALLELRIDTEKAAGKGITTHEELMQLTEQQIDQWKDLPLGHRVRLRKYIRLKQQPKQIEAIIKGRKDEQHFIVLDRRIEEQDDQHIGGRQEGHIGEEEQERMIQSLMMAFTQRPSALKHSTNYKMNNPHKQNTSQHVHWHPSVPAEEVEHKKYPKEVKPQLIPSERVDREEGQPKTYCWMCLKLGMSPSLREEGRWFCSQLCMLNYKLMIKQAQPVESNIHWVPAVALEIDLSIQ